MKCPHCNNSIFFEESDAVAYEYGKENRAKAGITGYDIAHGFCPSCNELIVMIREGKYKGGDYPHLENPQNEDIIYPRGANRPIEPEIPQKYASDFKEAVAVVKLSPKASAAISRRLLQSILREESKIKKSSLADEIEEFIHREGIPSHLSGAVDAVRNVGNFAAHPLKNTHTGEIVDVEPGEAEWLLDVLEAMFDFTFVQPKRLEDRKKQLNEKLKSLGKPEMKE